MLFQWIGDMTESDVREIIDLMGTIDHPLVFVIVDARRAGGFPPQGRQSASQSPHLHRAACVAYLGASVTTRVFVRMLTGAFRLLKRSLQPVYFVDTEEEARAYIQKRRREVRAATGARR